MSKAVTAILNRLAPQNFAKLSKEMVDLEVKSRTVLEAVRATTPGIIVMHSMCAVNHLAHGASAVCVSCKVAVAPCWSCDCMHRSRGSFS